MRLPDVVVCALTLSVQCESIRRISFCIYGFPKEISEGDIGLTKKKEKEKKKKKRTALVICRDEKQFWTTQAQFWQWVRDGVIVKTQDHPLTGSFLREHEESMVLLSNTVLNLSCPNHLQEALSSRRIGLQRK